MGHFLLLLSFAQNVGGNQRDARNPRENEDGDESDEAASRPVPDGDLGLSNDPAVLVRNRQIFKPYETHSFRIGTHLGVQVQKSASKAPKKWHASCRHGFK